MNQSGFSEAQIAPAKLTLCSALRDATHSIHQRLHKAALLERLLRGTLSMHDYRILLCVYAAYYAALAESLLIARRVLATGGEPSAGSYDEMTPLTLLRADLQSFDQQTTLPVIAALRVTDMQALGCLYVTEGSRLGARVLYNQLDRLFGKQRAGRSFLGASLHPTAWRAFCNDLDALTLHHEEVEEVISGAVLAFSLFEKLLQRAHNNTEQLMAMEQSA